jgi:lipopolysaccharide/colanic/teichoic acid biosynthesis glycosyltransferase
MENNPETVQDIRKNSPTAENVQPGEFTDGMNMCGRVFKRTFDLVVSGLCMIVFSPLILACYLAVKLTDGGPAIFKQERIGRYGKPFYIYKYRSMRVNAEEESPLLSHANGDDDSRTTPVGRFLRAHHLDELPQLWNVFRGDMAFVGYRPERKYYIDKIMEHDPRYVYLYQIRPGVTSYATLYNGYTDTMEKMLRRLELDLYYVKHRSWWFDCKILFLTFVAIIFGKKF